MTEEKQEIEVGEETKVDDSPTLKEQIDEKVVQKILSQQEQIDDALEHFKGSNFFKEKIVIGYTGHRPDKIYQRLSKRVANDYLLKHKDRIEFVVNGGCKGWDIAILIHCQRLGIPYKIFLAFEEDKRHLPQRVIDDALEITWEKKKYTTAKDKRHYHTRNRKIVQASDELHAYLRKQDGGTVATVLYAKEHTNNVVFNWYNLTYLQVPNGMSDKDFAGHRYYWFKEILTRLGQSLNR